VFSAEDVNKISPPLTDHSEVLVNSDGNVYCQIDPSSTTDGPIISSVGTDSQASKCATMVSGEDRSKTISRLVGFVELNKQKKSNIFGTAFWFLFGNAIIMLLIGLFLKNEIGGIIDPSNQEEYAKYSLLFFCIIAIDLISIIPFSLLRQQNRAIKFATIKTINIIVNIFFNIFFLLICPHLIEQNISTSFIESIYTEGNQITYVFVSNLIASFATLLLLAPEIKNNISSPNYRILKKMLNYAWPIFVAGLAFAINETSDKILLKHLLPKDIAMNEMGIYAACYKLTIFMILFVQAYRFAAEPFFFNQLKNPDAKKIYSLMLEVFVLVSLFVFLFVVLYLDIIKLIISDEKYHDGVKIVPIVLIANIFLGIYYNLSVWYKVTNKTKYGGLISGFGALLTILINIIFIPKIANYMVPAWATLICYASMAIMSFYLGQKHFKINYKIEKISIYFLIAIGLFFISPLFDHLGTYNNIQVDNTILFIIYTIFMYSEFKKIFKFKQPK